LGPGRLNQYALRLRKMRPGDRDPKLLNGLAKTLKIYNVDPNMIEAANPGNALAITEGLGTKLKQST
jgi:hypothetical protein